MKPFCFIKNLLVLATLDLQIFLFQSHHKQHQLKNMDLSSLSNVKISQTDALYHRAWFDIRSENLNYAKIWCSLIWRIFDDKNVAKRSIRIGTNQKLVEYQQNYWFVPRKSCKNCFIVIKLFMQNASYWCKSLSTLPAD